MLTLHDVLMTAAAGYSVTKENESLDAVIEFMSIWEDHLDAPLEDVQLSIVPEAETQLMDDPDLF